MPASNESQALVDELTQQLQHPVSDGARATVVLGNVQMTVDEIVPRCVVMVHSVKQLAQVARFAHERRLRLTPCGGKTQMQWGGPLTTVDILVDLSAMRRVLDYQPDDMTITIETGCTLAQLQDILARRNQFLPVDPAVDEGATIGGILATNATGPLRLAHGTLRDYLIGARVVRANGEITQAGGRVVKNAAGYELCKVYTGSYGTLGIIAEVTLMVRPAPESRHMVYVPLTRLDAAEPVIASLLDSHLEPTLLELVNQAALARASDSITPHLTTEPRANYGLFVGFCGPEAAVTWKTEQARQTVADLPAPTGHRLTATVLKWDDAYGALMQMRRASSQALVCRASMLSSEVAAFVDRAEALFRHRGLEVPIVSHAGSGVVHMVLDPIPSEAQTVIQSLLELASAVPVAPHVPPVTPVRGRTVSNEPAADTGAPHLQGLGDLEQLRRLRAGNLVVESAPAAWRKQLPVWGRQGAHQPLMQEVKQRFDPHLILNYGRVLGG